MWFRGDTVMSHLDAAKKYARTRMVTRAHQRRRGFRTVSVYLTVDQIDWLYQQVRDRRYMSVSAAVRSLIDTERNNQEVGGE